jgi:hypothetical protein
MESTEIQVVTQPQGSMMTLKNVTDRVNLVHEALKKVMVNETHYGKVPGCGDKMVLLKPGADLLAMMFRLTPSFQVTKTAMEGGHREYEVVCTMTAPDGTVLGQGVGSGCTMEKKYRYRTEWVGTEKRMVENPDIADVYNTVLKMAKKRAHVDATLTVTGAADLFTQDLIENEDGEEKSTRPPVSMPTEKKASPAATTAPAPDCQVTGIVEDVNVKDGKKADGTAWTKYGIKIGAEFYDTFSETIGQTAVECKGTAVELTWKAYGKYKTATAIEPVESNRI